jgi:hypothetical protein
MITILAAGLAVLLAPTDPVRSLTGTLAVIEGAKPTRLMVQAEGQLQNLVMTERAVAERETSFAGGGASTTEPIDRLDLTPGEFVRLELDAGGKVTRARAVAILERAKVRSASGATVVLEDGTTLRIGSVLRFFSAEGKPSATASMRPGESVVLYRHPSTRNIYRFSADARPRKPAETPRPAFR